MTKFIYKHKHWLFLILIIAIAIFFRFWQFDSIPSGLYQDEAMNGANALNSLESGKFNVFYPDNNGREGMIVWLDVLAIKFFGVSSTALRLFPAIAGVLAVLGLYFLAKELFTVEIALASSFFMAVSFWAVNFSRIGFRAGLMLPFLIWSFYFLIRGFEIPQGPSLGISQGRTLKFLLAGILFGLGFYTYISYRFAPILLFFLLYLVKIRIKKLWVGIAFFIVAAFIIALPIGVYFLNNPQDFFGRSSQVSIFSSENPIKAAVISLIASLGMFNILGDLNWRHNLSGFPQLFWPVGILFLVGLSVSIKRFEFREKFLLAWLFIFLLPNILTTEGNPHALRSLGAIPAAMIFAGIGLFWVYERFYYFINTKIKNPELSAYHNQLKRIKKLAFIFLIVFIFFVAFLEFNKYFYSWALNQRVADAFSQNQVEIANYLSSSPPSLEKYIIWPSDDRPTNNGLPVSAQTVYFLSYGKSGINYIKVDDFDRIKSEIKNAVIIPIYFDLEMLHKLNKQFPKSKIEFIYLNTPILVVP